MSTKTNYEKIREYLSTMEGIVIKDSPSGYEDGDIFDLHFADGNIIEVMLTSKE